ncbi:MAG: hypothetical protein ACRDID_11475 [Ktedonobacterales bacterium]
MTPSDSNLSTRSTAPATSATNPPAQDAQDEGARLLAELGVAADTPAVEAPTEQDAEHFTPLAAISHAL